MRKVEMFADDAGNIHRNERECLVSDLALHITKLCLPTDPPIELAKGLAAHIATLMPILVQLNEPRNHVRSVRDLPRRLQETSGEAAQPVAQPEAPAAPSHAPSANSANGILEEAARPLLGELRVGQLIEDDNGLMSVVTGFSDAGSDTLIGAVRTTDSEPVAYLIEEIKRVVKQPEEMLPEDEARQQLDAIALIDEGDLSPLDRTRRILLHRRLEQINAGETK